MLNFAFIDDENKRGRPRLGGCPRLEGVLRHICPRLTPFTPKTNYTFIILTQYYLFDICQRCRFSRFIILLLS